MQPLLRDALNERVGFMQRQRNSNCTTTRNASGAHAKQAAFPKLACRQLWENPTERLTQEGPSQRRAGCVLKPGKHAAPASCRSLEAGAGFDSDGLRI